MDTHETTNGSAVACASACYAKYLLFGVDGEQLLELAYSRDRLDKEAQEKNDKYKFLGLNCKIVIRQIPISA